MEGGVKHARIEAIQWGVSSSEVIKRTAAREVTEPKTQVHGRIVEGGPNDPRLGATPHVHRCLTCGSTAEKCPGHHGYTELPLPVPNYEFYLMIDNLMRYVCYDCGRVMILPNDARVRHILLQPPVGRFAAIRKAIKKIPKCPHCSYEQPVWTRTLNDIWIEAHFTVTGEEKMEDVPTFTPNDMWYQLAAVPDEDYELLGLNPKDAHPKDFLWTNFYIPPSQMRPSKGTRQCARNEDSLTQHLKTIVKLRNDLKGLPAEALESVNFAYYRLPDGPEFENYEQILNPDYVPPDEELNAKARYKQLARAIALYTNVSLVEKRPPNEKAKRQYGAVRDSLRCRNSDQHDNGFRANMMGKRVNRIGRSVAGPAGTGLSINGIGVPIAHCKILTVSVTVTATNIVDLTNRVRNGPNVHPGANFVIRDGHRYDLADQNTNDVDLRLGDVVERHLKRGDVVLCNRQPTIHEGSILAHIVEPMPGLTYRSNLAVTPPYNLDFDGDEQNLIVPNGEEARAEAMEMMLVEKKIVKNGQPMIKFVMHTMYCIYDIGDRWFTREQAMQLLLHSNQPYTIGYKRRGPYLEPFPRDAARVHGRDIFSRCLPDVNFQRGDVVIENGQWKSGLLKSKNVHGQNGLIMAIVIQGFNAAEFIDRVYAMMGYYTEHFGFSFRMSDCDIEVAYNRNLSPAQKREAACEAALEHMWQRQKGNNFLLRLHESGTKGSLMNIAQISCLLGQQVDEQNRPFEDPADREGNACVESSFVTGLAPREMFAHLRAGRIGVANTAIKTSQVGYSQRRLNKASEAILVATDGSVRNTEGELVMPYHSDGFNPDKITRMPFQVVLGEYSEIDALYAYLSMQLSDDPNWLNFMDTPVDPADLARRLARYPPDGRPPRRLYAVAQKYWRKLHPSVQSQKFRLYWLVHTRPSLLQHVRVEEYLEKIVDRVLRAMIEPGSAIGSRAAQDMSSVLMQKTLSQFHYAGEESDVDNGLNRYEAIVNLTTTANNNMVIFFDDDFEGDPEEFALQFTAKRLRKYLWRPGGKSGTDVRADGTILFHLDKEMCIMDLVSPRLIAERLGGVEYSPLHSDSWWVVCASQDVAQYLQADSDIVVNHEYVREVVANLYTDADIDTTTSPTNVYVRLDNTFEGSPYDVAMHLEEALQNISGIVKWKIVRPEGNLSVAKMPDDFRLEDMCGASHMLVWIKYEKASGSRLFMSADDGRKKYASVLHAESLEYRIFHGYEDCVGYTMTKKYYLSEMRPALILLCRPIKVNENPYMNVNFRSPDFCLIDVLCCAGVSRYSYSENTLEMQRLFGIGAAYNSIVNALMRLFDGDFARQIANVASVMTYTGKAKPVTSTGVRSTNHREVIKNAAYEGACAVMANAAAHGSYDTCSGIAASIVVSKRGPFGTGSVHIQPKGDSPRISRKRRNMLITQQPPLNGASSEDLRLALLDCRPKRRRIVRTHDFGRDPFRPAQISNHFGFDPFQPWEPPQA